MTGMENVCRYASRHTKCPSGYIDWHEWAEKKSRRHKQTICPGCKRFKIWVRRKKGEE